jgi:hypothetical protein
MSYALKVNLKSPDLRKEARYLENEIDTKLVSYSKVGANASFAVISEV